MYVYVGLVLFLLTSQTLVFSQSYDKTSWVGKKSPDLCVAIQYIDYNSS